MDQPLTRESASRILSDATRIDWPHALPAAATAGAVSAVFMLASFAGLSLGMIFGGMLCVILYRRRVRRNTLTSGMGARLGALSGILGFALFSIFTAVQVLLFHAGDQIRANLLESIKEAADKTPDPQMQPIFDYLRTPSGMQLAMATGFAVMLLMFLVLSCIGGVFGAALSRRQRKP
jgi:hypothetical protein